jgi:serine/threonine protein kinase/tetratricopeptide (TPR) repeat protein
MAAATNDARSIFHAALERANPQELAAYLDQACAGDAALRQRVDALLAAHDASGAFLSEARPDPNGTLAHAPATPLVGTVIAGRYKLLEEIGEGGMGTVWVAEQTEPVKRKVALKLIKVGMDSRSVLARFEAERQALAMMDHPNIAKVLDGGLAGEPGVLATGGGRPFFVMEYVKGIPITEYCDATRLSVDERLQLFVQVCSAVQHAHQKGIIHRDLKPSNILVAPYDDKPVPKVIDFGLAKAMHQSLTERTLHTGHETVLGTPLYMSPEQAQLNNLDVDTRADVYALGVLLYELLTGTTPLERKRFKEAAWDEIKRIIREEEPPRPSARLSSTDTLPALAACRQSEPLKLAKEVRGELDWIVMKSLEKERTRRYETANGFAQDVQRYLAGEPVLAVPPRTGYRLKKFVKRHKGRVLAAGLVLAALVAGVVGTTFGMFRAEQARGAEAEQRGIAQAKEAEAVEEKNNALAAAAREADQRVRAEKARDRTADVLDAMTSTATGDSLATQKHLSEEQKKFLTDALTYYREFALDKVEDEPTRKRVAAAAFRVGEIESRLGREEEAAAAYRMARDGYAALAGDFPQVPGYRGEQARSHIKLGNMLSNLGKGAEAEAEYRQALTLSEKLVADLPDVPLYRHLLAKSHGNLARFGKGTEGVAELLKAQTIIQKLVDDFPKEPDYRRDLAMSHNNMGAKLAELGKRAEEEDERRKALEILEKLVAEFPNVPQYRQELATCHWDLGDLLDHAGRRIAAEDKFRKAVAILEKLVAEFPAVPDYRANLGELQQELADRLRELDKPAEAEAEYRKALAILAQLAADFPKVPQYRHGLAASHNNLSMVLGMLGKLPEAAQERRKALVIYQKLADEFPKVADYRKGLAESHYNLAILLEGRPAEAENRKALAFFEKLAAEFPKEPEYRQNLSKCHRNLGDVLRDLGKPAEAEEEVRKALAIAEKLAAEFPKVPEYRDNLALNYNSLAASLTDHGKRAEAETEFRKALAIHKRLADEFPDAPVYRQHLAATLYNFAVHAINSAKEPEKKQEHGDRAMDFLRQAVKAGLTDAELNAANPALNPLRDHEDFKKLVEELKKKPAGKPEKKP